MFFKNMFLHTTTIIPKDNYCLYAEFNNGAKGTVDLSQELWGAVFEPLTNPALFATAKQNPIMQTVQWDNGADFAPEFLHDLLLKQSNKDKLPKPKYFSFSDLFSKHTYESGHYLIDEEYDMIEALCEHLVHHMPIVAGKWRLEICCKNFHYLQFVDINTEASVNYFDMLEKDRRAVDAAFDAADLI